MNEDQERKIMYGLLVLLIIAIIATAVIFYKPAEPYTTLYFTEPLQIKINVSVNEPFYVNFTVENHEQKMSHYSYIISLIYYKNQTPVEEISLKHGKIILSDNETASISEKIVIKDTHSDRIKVSVELSKEGVDGTYRGLQYWAELQHQVQGGLD